MMKPASRAAKRRLVNTGQKSPSAALCVARRLLRGILAACLFSAIPLFATSAYMTDSAHEFGTIDLTSGVFTRVATTSTNVYGMGFGLNGTLYGTDPSTPANVYTINPSTGATTRVGAAATSYDAYGSTVGPDGLIYALSGGNSAAFYSISTSTLATRVINPSVGFPTYGLAVFDAGKFYTDVYDSGNSVLLQIDPTTGVATEEGAGVGAPAYAGTLVGNTIYAVGSSFGTPILGTIDPATGSGTFIAYITGMAAGASPASLAAANVPEPATPLLIALCLPVLVIYRRRPRRSSTEGATVSFAD